MSNESKQAVSSDSFDEKEEIALLHLQVAAVKRSLQETQEKYAALLRKGEENEDDACHEVDALYSQIDLLKKTLSQQQQKHAQEIERLIADRDASLAALNASIDSFKHQHIQDTSEKERALHDNIAARAARDDAEEHLKIAHQHLSKKVRETTELAEKLTALQSSLDQLNAQILLKNETLGKLETSLHNTEDRELALRRELQELKRAYEGKQSEWQSQLSTLKLALEQERLEKDAMRVYEERCHQIARYWDSMGKVLWDKRSGDELIPTMLPRQPHRPYQNLIDISLPSATNSDDPIGGL